MTTYYEIPAFIRRAEEDQEGDANAVRYYSEGYADSMVNIEATHLRSIATTYLNDINNRKLIHSNPEYAVDTIDTALKELRLALSRLAETQDFIRNNLIDTED